MTAGTVSARKLALILLAILAVRIIALWLNRTDLFFDEAQYWSWAQEPALGYYSKPPLIAWVIAASTAVCGDGEPCVRLAAPVLHTVTAWVIALIGCRLYDARVGFWSGIVFATLPGVSVSSGIISTDVPFLLCWALALWGFARLRETGSLGDAVLLGAAIGAGFMARYSMAFFVGSMLVALIVIRGRGVRIAAGRWMVVALFALAVFAPNLYWNYANGFPTFGHTADNAKWTGSLFHPLKALEFFGAQFGVFGPVLFGALVVIVWRLIASLSTSLRSPSPLEGEGGVGGEPQSVRSPLSPPPQAPNDLVADAPKSKALGPCSRGGREERHADRLLLSFVLPILLIYIAQAFLSRAHANWAAAGYVAATVLVVATMLRDEVRGWFRGSLWLHGVLAAIIALAPATAGKVALPGDPFRRMLGWREMADNSRREIKMAADNGKPYAAIVIDDRGTLAEHIYYLRDVGKPILAWPSGPAPKDHYELTRPYRGGGPILIVSQGPAPKAILERFSTADVRVSRAAQPGVRDWRSIELYRLDGYRPAP